MNFQGYPLLYFRVLYSIGNQIIIGQIAIQRGPLSLDSYD